MTLNSEHLEKYKSNVIIVEGKKDISSLTALGFEKVHSLNKNLVSLRERIEQISLQISKNDKISILTDLDKKGNQLYSKIKPIFQELGFTLDSKFRSLLIKEKISHVEGLHKFLENQSAD